MTDIPVGGTAGGFRQGFSLRFFSGATCNPALVPGGCNSMGERSYFIVDRHY